MMSSRFPVHATRGKVDLNWATHLLASYHLPPGLTCKAQARTPPVMNRTLLMLNAKQIGQVETSTGWGLAGAP